VPSLSASKQFSLVFDNAKIFNYQGLLILKYSLSLKEAFLGFAIGKNFGSAVCRNRFKRICRACFKESFDESIVGVIVRPLKPNLDTDLIEKAFMELKKTSQC